jgi:hypothetical protein
MELMKKAVFSLTIVFILLIAISTTAYADKPVQTDANGNEVAWENSHPTCTTIQSGLLTDSLGRTLSTGYDEFGYNYQAHMFNGTYDGSDRVLDGKYWGSTVDYVDDHLMMKWSDEWLANVDCNGDGKLDRGLVEGSSPTGTSYGWTTNHVEGDYIGSDGNLHTYTDFVKIVWVGTGGSLWGQYEIIEEVYNDPFGGFNGLLYKENPAGLGQQYWP